MFRFVYTTDILIPVDYDAPRNATGTSPVKPATKATPHKLALSIQHLFQQRIASICLRTGISEAPTRT